MLKRTGSIALSATVLAALLAGTALADTPGTPIVPASTTVLVAGGAGTQTDPHISGSLATYTNRLPLSVTDVRIHYQDLATGTASDAAIPAGADEYDQLSDVSGSTVVFQRTNLTTGSRSITAFDTAGAGPVELAPDAAVRRENPSIGGRTVSWVQAAGLSVVLTDIYAYDLGTGVATALTSDGVTSNNRDPAVSADGSVIAWTKCDGWLVGLVSCDIWSSIRGVGGTWGAPVQLTAISGAEIVPDTNGQVVVYASRDGSGETDIEWLDVAGTNPHTLVMSGNETNPNISGSLVSFEHTDIGASNADLFAYDLASGTLYRLTATSTVGEALNDISVAADGTVRVVFAAADSLGKADVFALTFHIVSGPAYKICPLFDQAKSHRLGSVVAIRLRLCDADGANLSSASLTLTATGLVKKDSSASTAVVEDAGNANPDSAFRYDETLAGYVYNLSTRGLSRGTWELQFTVSGDPTTYGITFDLR